MSWLKTMHNQPSVIAAIGKTGSGKSYFVKELIEGLSRVAVWDFKREYPKHFKCRHTESITQLVQWIRTGKFFVAFWPSMDAATRARQFNLFCRAVYAAGDLAVVVEELKFVTTPQRAPDAWSLITSTGRHEGLKVIGTSQRPAQIDKDFLGNCDRIRCYKLTYGNDGAAVAQSIPGTKAIDFSSLKVRDLKTMIHSDFIEHNDAEDEFIRGTVKIRKKKTA